MKSFALARARRPQARVGSQLLRTGKPSARKNRLHQRTLQRELRFPSPSRPRQAPPIRPARASACAQRLPTNPNPSRVRPRRSSRRYCYRRTHRSHSTAMSHPLGANSPFRHSRMTPGRDRAAPTGVPYKRHAAPRKCSARPSRRSCVAVRRAMSKRRRRALNIPPTVPQRRRQPLHPHPPRTAS